MQYALWKRNPALRGQRRKKLVTGVRWGGGAGEDGRRGFTETGKEK